MTCTSEKHNLVQLSQFCGHFAEQNYSENNGM